jgi:hypothetical protein
MSSAICYLHRFDRLRVQGTLPSLYAPELMQQQLWAVQVLHRNFKDYAQGLTKRMRTALELMRWPANAQSFICSRTAGPRKRSRGR